MTNTQHTPGPWTRETDGKTWWVQTLAPARLVIATGLSEANARLIAEAPTLLSLAKRWAALDAGAWAVDRHAADKAELLAYTRAVIAKAEGRS